MEVPSVTARWHPPRRLGKGTQVRFLPGFFAETLPRAPIESLAILRLDGDYYSSTWDALAALYPLLSPGECTA